MKIFTKNRLIAFIAVFALLLGGCAKQGETAKPRRQKFQVVSLDKVNGSINEGWRITLTRRHKGALHHHTLQYEREPWLDADLCARYGFGQ